MLTTDEEQKIRDSVRRSLMSLRQEKSADAEADDPEELEKLGEAERIIAEETERYYTERGLVRHVTRSGRVTWLPPAEAARAAERRTRPKRKHRRRFDRRVVMVWTTAILVSLLAAAYLIKTQVVGIQPIVGQSGESSD